MILSLPIAFQLCAAPFERENRALGVDVIRYEIQWQLNSALAELMANYNIDSDIHLKFDKRTMAAAEVTLDVLCPNNPQFPQTRKDSLKATTFFLEDLVTYADRKMVNIDYCGGEHIARIKYVASDFAHTLLELRADNFPEDILAIRHLYFAQHLLERARDYVPSFKLH